MIDWELVATLNGEGRTAQQIADEVGCHIRTISRWRVQNGVSQSVTENVGHPISAEKLAAIELMLQDGASFADIIRTLSVSSGTLHRHFPGRGWSAIQAGQLAAMVRQLNRLQGLQRHHKDAA